MKKLLIGAAVVAAGLGGGVARAEVDTNPNGHPPHPIQPIDTQIATPGQCNINSDRPADNGPDCNSTIPK